MGNIQQLPEVVPVVLAIALLTLLGWVGATAQYLVVVEPTEADALELNDAISEAGYTPVPVQATTAAAKHVKAPAAAEQGLREPSRLIEPTRSASSAY